MDHIVYKHGKWYTVDKPWQNSCAITGAKQPEVGDTFSDFTSSREAHQDLAHRGLKTETIRRAMWGEGDYRIVST
jgi:hypothetical protein